MSLINSIKNYMLSCPLIKTSANINIDFLGPNTIGYSISRLPCEPIIKKYTDGSCIQQFQFTFTSVNEYNTDETRNMVNNDFYEELEKWIEKQNEIGNLPIIENGTSLELQINTCGSLLSNEVDTAKYQIKFNLIYRRK